MTLTLINRSGRCLGLNLPHARVCTAGACGCTLTADRPPRRICRSLTLPAGHAATGLPEAVLAAPEVRAAVARGELEVRRREPKLPAPEPRKKRPRRTRGGTR